MKIEFSPDLTVGSESVRYPPDSILHSGFYPPGPGVFLKLTALAPTAKWPRWSLGLLFLAPGLPNLLLVLFSPALV